MRAVVALEHRFYSTPDGAVWTPTTFPYSYWTRWYLSNFDHVRILARVGAVASASPEWLRADGAGVSFISVPYYLDAWRFLARLPRIKGLVRSAVGQEEAVIIRAPSVIGNLLVQHLDRSGFPYAVIVLGDPDEIFAPGVMRHPLRPLVRTWLSQQLRRQCLHACAVSYVTSRALQKLYPASPSAFSCSLSDVDLPSAAFAFRPRWFEGHRRAFMLITVASLERPYKGVNTVIVAVHRCRQSGLNLNLVVVGDGRYRSEFEAQVARQNLEQSVFFAGRIPAGEAVRRFLDASDLFVLPSKSEGLPQSLLEAMARALPCIASPVGGIPELLPAEDMTPPDDARALAEKIGEVLGSARRMERMSARNLSKAAQFQHAKLAEMRNRFFAEVMRRTADWSAGSRMFEEEAKDRTVQDSLATFQLCGARRDKA